MAENPKGRPDNEWDQLPTVVTSGGALARKGPQPVQNALSLELAPPRESGEEEEGVDLLHYWRIIVKRRWTVLSVIVAAIALAVIQTMMTTPMFQATSTIQIDYEPIRVVNAEGVIPNSDYSYLPTQLEVLRSRSLAERVVQHMGLAEGQPIAIKPSPLAAFFQSIFLPDQPATDTEAEPAAPVASATPAEVDEAAMQRARIDGMTSFVRGGTSVQIVGDSRLVQITFISPDADLSARIANGIAEAYIESNIDRRMDASSFATKFLETSLADTKAKLEQSERALIAFAQEQELLDVDSNAPLATQNMVSLNEAISMARRDRINAEARLRSLQSGPLAAIPEVLTSDLINSLKETRSTLAGEYQQKLATFKPEFPEMKQLQGRIDEVDRQIEAAIQTIKASIEAEFRAASQREQMLQEQLDSSRDEVFDVRARSVEYNILKREVETNRQQYEALLSRYKEVGLAGGVGTNNISIVDRAQVPGGPFKPNLTTNIQAGLMLGLILGILLALLVEYLDDTIKAPEDVERKLHVPLLGVIPKIKVNENVQALMSDPRSAFSEAYRSLRTALQFATDRGVPRTLLVTSSSMAEGKSTTAYVLAFKFSQLGKRVLLIDCDLRNPSLHKRIPGAVNTNGLSSYLAGAIKPQEMVRASGIDNLSFAPTGTLPPNPAELLASPRMSALLTVASHKYDLVILDGPPIMGLADVPILAHLAAGTLIVVEAAETRVGMVTAALKRLQAARARVVGTVLTKYDARTAGYGYGYGYSYSYYSYGTTPGQKQLGRA
jgi:capsular exopolysaccharide synthesis family protein